MSAQGRMHTPGHPGHGPGFGPIFFSFPISGPAHLDAQTQHIPTTRPASSRLAHRHVVFSPKLQLPNAPTPDCRRRCLLVPASAPALPGLGPWQAAARQRRQGRTRHQSTGHLPPLPATRHHTSAPATRSRYCTAPCLPRSRFSMTGSILHVRVL